MLGRPNTQGPDAAKRAPGPRSQPATPPGSLLDSCFPMNLDPHLLPKLALRALPWPWPDAQSLSTYVYEYQKRDFKPCLIPFSLESFCTMLCIFQTSAPCCPCRPDCPSPPSPSLTHDHGELGDTFPKGRGAPGTTSVALPFSCEEHIPGVPPGSGAGASGHNISEGRSGTAIEPLSDAGL